MEMHDRACKSYMEHAKVEGEHVCKNVSLIPNDLDIMPCHAMPCHAMPCHAVSCAYNCMFVKYIY